MALPLINGRRYGYKKNPIDIRDYGLGSSRPLREAEAPAMNNGQFMGPVLDQGQQGSCTAHAGVADREYLHWKQIAADGGTVSPGTEGLYSPSFLYYIERQLDGTLGQGDAGSTGRTSCRALNQYGCCLRADMPYNDSDCSTAPTAAQLADGTKWPTGQYHFLSTVSDMKNCIASGYNFRVGFTVYESFEDIGADGIWTPNTQTEQVVGGHEVLCYGYDDTVNGGSFLIRNSWAADWGKNGDFYMRYVDAIDPNIQLDAAIQHLGRWS
jgi:C1A family cysteine protease